MPLFEFADHDLGPDHRRFSRTDFSINKGGIIRTTNIGGEPHSFTEVPEFGGGCADDLNIPLGLTVVTANCPADFATLVFPGQSGDISGLAVGEHKFMCIIHPWMSATVQVKRTQEPRCPAPGINPGAGRHSRYDRPSPPAREHVTGNRERAMQ